MDDLSNGDYYKAFELFLFDVERFAAEYESGQAFDVNHKVTLTDPLADAIETLPLIALVALIVSLVTVFVMKGKLKTARRKPAADEYVSEGSFALTGAHDLYLYTTTTRVKIESESSGGGSSTHSSSSGTSHGGGGGKF